MNVQTSRIEKKYTVVSRNLLIPVLFVGLLFPSFAWATIYQPGETLEPDCAPETLNCGVATSTTSFELNGQSVSTQTLVIGSSGTDFAISSAGGVHTFNIPSASILNRGLVTTGSQIFGGDKTFNDAAIFSGNFSTPRALEYNTTGIQNDVDLGTGSYFHYGGAGDATFTGLAGGTDGRSIRILNDSSFSLTFTNEDSGSLAANRFETPNGTDITLEEKETITLMYDAQHAVWHVVAYPVTSSNIKPFAFIQGGNNFAATAVLGVTDANALDFITSGFRRFTVATSSATLSGDGATTLTSNSTLALSSAAGSALTVTSGTTGPLTLDSGSTGAVNVGTGGTAKTVTVGNTTGASILNLKSGTGGINMTGLVMMGNASTTLLSAFNGLFIGSTATSTIVGDNGVSTLRSDVLVTGSTTLQNVTMVNATTSGTLYATNLTGDAQNATLARIGNSTFSTLQDLQNVFHSSGWTSGGAIADIGGGAVSVAAGTGLIRPSDSPLATVFYTDWVASSSVSIPTDTTRYIGVEYNGGSPRITSRTSSDWDYRTDFPLGVVSNENGTIHIANDVQGVGDHAAQMIRREYETMPLARDERDGGLELSESADANRNIMLSSGVLWDRLSRYPITAVDTSGSDTFDTYTGTTQQVAGETQWDNTSYDNGGVLTALDPGKYAILWFYVETDGSLVMVYGTNQYATLAAAVTEEEPMTLPLRVVSHGRLVGRLVFQKSAGVAVEVDSAFDMNQFSSTALTFLSNLQGLDYQSSGLTGFVASDGIGNGQTIIGGTSTTAGLTLQSTSAAGTTDFVRFLVGNNGTTEAGRFLSNGNFGIGTTSPYAKLSVAGEAVVRNLTATSTTDTSSFAGPVSVTNTLNVTGLSTLANLLLTGSTTLQNFTAFDATTLNATTTNLAVSGASQLGTVISGTWNGTAVGPTFGGTNQTTWATGDILYASAPNTLSRLTIGGTPGDVLTVGVGGVPTWAPGGSGSSGDSQWATSTDSLRVYPTDPTRVVVVGASATTTLGQSVGARFEVSGNSVLSGSLNATDIATFSGGASTTNASISGILWVGGNATTTANGAFTTNGLITAAAAGTGLSVTNNASVGGLVTAGTLLVTGSTTLQNFTAGNSTTTNASTTNLYATNFFVDNFSPANLSTGGTLSVTGPSTLSGGASTTNASVSGILWVGGNATTTNGIADVSNKYQINSTDVLTATTLGSGVTNSSLTSVGTLGSLVVSGHAILGNASTTDGFSVAGTLWVGGNATTTSGTTNVSNKYQINGTDVITATTLGSGVVNSSLTSVGTLSSLSVSGLTMLGNASTTLLSSSGGIFVNGNATTSANGNFATAGTITSGLVNGQTVSSAANFTGTLTAASLVTASNGLTLVSGSLTLPTASVADAALSSNVALLNRTGQAFTGTNSFSALTTLGNASTTQLSVSGNFDASGNIATPKGADYPTTGSQNNVNLGVGSLFRYTGAGSATFTGITGGADGRFIRIMNASASNLTLADENISSTAANRIRTGTGANLTIAADVTVGLQYDSGTSRWRVVVLPATSTSINTFAFVQGGNAFGTTATVGTTDANALTWITGGNTRFTLASGATTLTGTGATTLTTDSTLALSSAAGSALTVTSGTTGAVTVDSGTTGAVNIGTGANAKIVTIGNATGGTSLVLNAGTGNIDIGANAIARTINIGTGASVIENINLGGTGANVVAVGNTQTAGSVSIGAAMTGGTISIGGTGAQTGNFDLAPGTGVQAITLANSTGAKTISIGGGISGNTISLGNGANTSAQTINIAAGAAGANSTVNILTGIATAGTQTLNLGTGASAKTINIGNTTGASALNLNAGSGNINMQVSGTGTTGNVQIGAGGAGSATPDLLVLDVKSTSGDPTGTAGAMYYNSNTGKFRCFENSVWVNCTGSASDLQTATSFLGTDVALGTGATSTLTTVNVTPTTATGDAFIQASVSIRSASNTDGTVDVAIRKTNCTGTVLANMSEVITEASNIGASSLFLTAIEVDPGASSQTYALCGRAITQGHTATDYSLSATIIDTGADYAEIYTTNDETLEPGDVVSLDAHLQAGVQKSSGIYDDGVIGIVSTRPGILTGSVEKEGVKAVPIALSGRVPVKVVTENGVIEEGDFLTPSSVPGVAMKAQGAGSVIGQAMTGFSAEGVGTVLAFVKNFAFNKNTLHIDELSATSTFIATIQFETPRDSVSFFAQKITNGLQFVADFVTARITAIRGYFDELFAKKIHTEEVCVKKSDGTEVCLDGDRLQEVLDRDTSAPHTTPPPVSEPTPEVVSEPDVATEPEATSSPDVTPEPEVVLEPESVSETPPLETETTPSPDVQPESDVVTEEPVDQPITDQGSDEPITDVQE